MYGYMFLMRRVECDSLSECRFYLDSTSLPVTLGYVRDMQINMVNASWKYFVSYLKGKVVSPKHCVL